MSLLTSAATKFMGEADELGDEFGCFPRCGETFNNPQSSLFSAAMKTIKIGFVSAWLALLACLRAEAQESSSLPYEQRVDVVYGEVHGTGL